MASCPQNQANLARVIAGGRRGGGKTSVAHIARLMRARTLAMQSVTLESRRP
jgi:hypothetical protein